MLNIKVFRSSNNSLLVYKSDTSNRIFFLDNYNNCTMTAFGEVKSSVPSLIKRRSLQNKSYKKSSIISYHRLRNIHHLRNIHLHRSNHLRRSNHHHLRTSNHLHRHHHGGYSCNLRELHMRPERSSWQPATATRRENNEIEQQIRELVP